MKYLKIFLKNIILIYLLLSTGCVSLADNSLSETNISDTDAVKSPLKRFEEPVVMDPVPDIEVVDEVYFDNLQWSVSEEKMIIPLILLPEPPIREKAEKEIIPPSYYGFHNMGLRADERELVYIPPEKSSNASVPEDVIRQVEENLQPEDKNAASVAHRITTVITEKIINASTFDKLEILLDGRGWIYLPDKENQDIVYSGRKFNNENTIYTFIPKIEGDFELRFQFQDLNTDIFKVEKINLQITTSQTLVPDTVTVVPDDPENEDTAFYENFDLVYSVNNMIQNSDADGLLSLVPDLLNSKDPEMKNLLPDVAEFFYNKSFYVSSVSIIEMLIKNDDYDDKSDYFLYLLGNIYEKDSSIRNEKKSAMYYKMLMDSYPVSIYWEESQDRYRFLKRRYIDIR